MLNLLSHQDRDVHKSRLSMIVQNLAAFHGKLAPDFTSLGGKYEFRVISYFQEEQESPESETCEVVSSKMAIPIHSCMKSTNS